MILKSHNKSIASEIAMPWAPKTHQQMIKQRRGGLTPARRKTAERGYGGRWQRIRKIVLSRDPVCAICQREASNHADHIVPKANGGTDDLGNLQGLCEECHNRKTATEDGGFGNA